MDKRRSVPVRVKPRQEGHNPKPAVSSPVDEAAPPVTEAEEVESPTAAQPPVEGESVAQEEQSELDKWRDRALRLEAEIDNFRKRQRKLADESIAADRARLLRSILPVADNLGRALATDEADVQSLRQGVDITRQELMRVLTQEGVETIPAEGQPFDPSWHEAVGSTPHQEAGVEPGTVVHMVEPGYRLGERLLRPARVIVAM